MKEWKYSFDNFDADQTLLPTRIKEATEKVLGVAWNPIRDEFLFKIKLDFTVKKGNRSRQIASPIPNTPHVLTRRIILSQTNSIYNPLGLAGPFTVRAKISLRRLWMHEKELGWDDPIPEENNKDWATFFQDLRGRGYD